VSDGVTLDVKVIPRAGRNALAGIRDGCLLIRLAAAPVDGAANRALIALLSSLFDVPKRNVAIVSGETSRQKRVRIEGVTAEAVRRRCEQT
jgi:uncharacterized protein (TIGR00251 family)